MTSRHTWFWLFLAAGLLAFIVLYQMPARRSATIAPRVLPNLKAAEVASIEVLPKGLQLGIRAERTNGGWQLTKPVSYPAQATNIDDLLQALEQLTPAARIGESELATNRSSAETYGFTEPQATLILGRNHYRLRIGRTTPPGDQVYVQLVSGESADAVDVVDAGFLKLIPHTDAAWRDTALLGSRTPLFDRLTVTNGGKVLEFRREGVTQLWRMTRPRQARVDNAKIETALGQLQGVCISQFVSDDPKADLETFGLQPPDLELALAQGSNTLAVLQFGRTNTTGQVYVRRAGQPTIFTVPAEPLAPWHGSDTDFYAHYLVAMPRPVTSVEVMGEDHFSLERQTNDTWRVLPQDFPADAGLAQKLINGLSEMPIAEFKQTEADDSVLPQYGLAPPSRRYVFKWASTEPAGGLTNLFTVDMQFGATNGDTINVRRANDEYDHSIYAVRLSDFRQLPAASWQLRERRLWDFDVSQVARLTLRQAGRVRQLLHKDAFVWTLAPGSNGMIGNADDLAIEEAVRGLAQMSVIAWAGRGAEARARCGFTDAGRQVTLELKNGDKVTVEFGGESRSGVPYAAVMLDGQPWIFEFPALLYRDVTNYLSVPPNP